MPNIPACRSCGALRWYATVLNMSTPLANITTRQVAEMAYVDPSTVRRWVEQGKLTPAIITPGGQYRFNEAEVLRQLTPSPSVQEAS